MVRKEFVIAGVLAAAGIAGGIWLFPGKQDVARMEVRDYNYDKPEEIYESRFNNGDHSTEVTQQLVRIHTSTGNIDRAIVVMETYVNEHLEDNEALKQLGTLYQYAQRYPDYMKILEKRAAERDDPVILKEMSQLYNFFQQTDKQRDVLEKLYKLENGSDPETIKALASFASLNKDFPKVAELMEVLRTKHPKAYDDQAAVSHLDALLRQQKMDEGLTLVKEWVHTEGVTAAQKATLIDMLHYQGAPRYALEALAELPEEEITNSADLLHSRLLLLLAQGKQKEAYASLSALYDQGKLPELLMPDLMYLAAVNGDNERFDAISKKSGFGQLNESQLADVYVSARRAHQTSILKAISQHVSNAAPENYPLMRALILLSERSPARHAAVRHLLDDKQNNDVLFKLAEASAEAGDANYARQAIAKLPEMDKLTTTELAALESLYLRLNDKEKAKQLVAYAEQSGKLTPTSEIGLRTAAATGDASKLRSWRASGGMSSHPGMYEDLFYQASNNGHLQLALEIANWQDDPAKTATSRRGIADIYTRLGRYADALSLLEQDAPRNEQEKQNRIYLASKLAPKSPVYREKLKSMARSWFPGASKATKEDITYALMNSGEPASALPYMKPMADNYGGEWTLVYADSAEKAGDMETATQYRLKAARDPKISPETKLGLAYALADRGYRNEAETLLSELTTQPALKMQATEQLVYIWSPRPTDSQVEWLIGEWKSAANPDDKSRLAALLDGVLQADVLDAKIALHPELRDIASVNENYLQRLALKGQLQPEIDAAAETARASGNVRTLYKLGNIARANGGLKEARSAYDHALAVDPNFAPALIGGTIAAASQSDYQASNRYFVRYLELANKDGQQVVTPDIYQAYFAYAEGQRRDRGQEKARPYYTQALHYANEAPVSAESLSVAAQSSAWLGDDVGSKVKFEEGFARYPNNQILRADRAALLIEQKRYDDARTALSEIRTSAANPQELRAALVTAGESGSNQTPEIYNEGEQVLIHTRHASNEPRYWISGLRNHPAVSYVSEGYDSVLVVANPGYRFATSGNEGGWSLSAMDETGAAYRSEAGQLALRKELLSARLDLETGQLKSASDRMEKLEGTYKQDPQYLGFAANTYYYNGIWPAAKKMITEARKISPDNADIARMKNTIDRTHPNFVQADVQWYNRGDNRDLATRLSGETLVKGPWTIGGHVTNHNVKTKGELQPSGLPGSRSGNRQDAEIYGVYSNSGHDMWTGHLYANNDTAGAGLDYTFLNSLGQTKLSGEYHKPYLDYIEGILDDAVRDRISAYHTIKPATDWEVGFGASLNNYSTDFADDVYKSWGLDVNVVHAIRLAQPYIGIGYGLLAEYELDSEKQLTATNLPYRRFPLRSREIHFLSATFAHDFSDKTYGSLMVGYGYDRLGGHGPAVEGEINHNIYGDWDVGANAYYGISASNSSDDDLSILGAYVRRRF